MNLQLLKHPTAKRTKNIIKLGKYAKYRRIMTGSPVTKNPLDLYTQCEFFRSISFRPRFLLFI